LPALQAWLRSHHVEEPAARGRRRVAASSDTTIVRMNVFGCRRMTRQLRLDDRISWRWPGGDVERLFLHQLEGVLMATEQKPLKSGFGAQTTAREVLAGA